MRSFGEHDLLALINTPVKVQRERNNHEVPVLGLFLDSDLRSESLFHQLDCSSAQIRQLGYKRMFGVSFPMRSHVLISPVFR